MIFDGSIFDTPYFEPDMDNVLCHSVVEISQAIIDKAVEVSCESQGVQEGDKNNIYFHQHTIIAVPTISSPSSLRKCIPIDYNMCSIPLRHLLYPDEIHNASADKIPHPPHYFLISSGIVSIFPA